jgi:hypothetical protein
MSASRRVPPWVWIAAAPLALFLLAWGALGILLPPERATRLVREQLSRSLAREVRFEKVSLSLFPPVRLAVRRLELAEPGGFERGAAFSATSLDLDLDVPALLGRQVRVRRLALAGPALHLLLRADGTTNLDGIGAAPGGKPGAAPPPALDLDVREFRVRDGGVLVDDLRAGRRMMLRLETRMDLVAEKGGARVATGGETVLSGLTTGPLTARSAGEMQQGLARLEWNVRHRGKFDAAARRLALEELALRLGGTQVALSGLVDSVGPRARYALQARGSGVDLAQVLEWVAVADAKAVSGITGRGALAFDLAARGSVAPGALPALTGVLTVRDAAFRYPGAPAEVSDLAFAANFRPDSLVIPDLRARVSGQPVAARLAVWRFADPMLDFAVRGNVDLAAIAPALAAKDTRLAGRAAVDLSGRGRAKDPGTLALAGAADLHDVSVEGAGLPKKVERVNGRVEFSAQRATVKQLSAGAGQSSFTLDAGVGRPLALLAEPGKVPPADVDFTFRSPHLDLAELLPTTPGAPFLPNARGAGRVAIARLKQGRLDVSDVEAEVKLSPAALESPRFKLQGYGGSVRGDARFDLRDTRKPVYAVRAVVDTVKAGALLGAWTPVRDLLAGTLSTNLEFSGAGQTPDDLKRTLTLVGLAAISEGRFGPGPALEAVARFVKVPKLRQLDFRKLELPMHIRDGRLTTDAVQLSGPSGDWKLVGAVGFDGALDYAVSVTLPPAAVEALGARAALAAGALADPQGRMLLDLRVSGPARAPRVAWDTDAMRARLAGRASEALAGQRAKLEADAREAARRALLERLGGRQDSAAAGDSAAATTRLTPGGARDTLRSAAKGVLEGFFGRKKGATPAPPPAPAPDSTPR